MAVSVPREEAEGIRELACRLGALDRSRKIVVREGRVEIPVLREIPGKKAILQAAPRFYSRMPRLDELLRGRIDDSGLKLLPRGWYIVGDVIVVKIHPRLQAHRQMIGEALLQMYPRCRCALSDSGVEGQFRQPCREVIAGGGTKTIHRENGVVFKLDARRIMFSPGNLMERTRMSRLGRGEEVVDMFAGIGYFTVPMAVHSRPRRILAIEINPLAYAYLQENVRINGVSEIVQPVLGDCLEATPEGRADRAVMGMVGITDRYLTAGIRALRPGGVLHYHQTVPSRLFPQRMADEVAKAAGEQGREAEIVQVVRVKKYSPGVVHGVADAVIW
ncbi:MAG: class I SAM-dependent methyltransferase family protein [Methanosarcinales archaeon]|nr:class I SAM-dependent methyltransferase family protein [Methanosarcinales archaeon]